MKIKSYFARTVEDAMAQARQELGPEAMLVNSRKAAPEARDLGEYEVVFAADTGSAPTAERPAPLAQPFGDRLSMEVAELKRELEGMRRTLTRSAFAPSQWLSSSPDLSEAYAVLTSTEVAPEAIRGIVNRVLSRVGTPETPVAAITSSAARYFLRQIVEPSVPSLFFLAHNEVPPGIKVQSLGNIQ